MPNPSLEQLLTRLEAAKSTFGRGESQRTEKVLRELSRREFSDPRKLVRFHEALLFLRAFPQSPSVIPPLERALNSFHKRIQKLRRAGANMSAFDDFETSGIAGTTMQDTLSFDVARWLVRRIPANVEIAWDDYEEERAMGSTWPRFIPLLEEDGDVEANIPWRRWLQAAQGKARSSDARGPKDLEWLIRQFEKLPVSDRERSELYDSLRLPIRWNLASLRFSRSRNWSRPRHFYYHTGPLITRRQVSLDQELAQPAPKLTKLSRRAGEAVLQTAREVMAVRYRELYGTTLGDPGSVVRADFGSGEDGRGVVIHLWSLPASRRLPLRAYVAGFTLKNGVAINYMEAIGLCEWMEVGFNTFYTFRQGETAWIYAQALRCLHQFTGVTTISVHPYQIGQGSDEAIESGAFWFYRKLGFRSGRSDLEKLARREEQKIAANLRYRTPPRILKQLAEAHVFYELGRGLPQRANEDTNRKSTTSSRAARSASTSALAAEGNAGLWDTFSVRNLGLRVNRRMAAEFDGDSESIRRASVKKVARALGATPTRWNSAERRAFENWALVLALVPDLQRWTKKEKAGMTNIIRAQAGPDEMYYLHLTQQHSRLRDALLRLNASLD